MQEKEQSKWEFGGISVEAPSDGMSALSYEQRRVSRAEERGVSMMGWGGQLSWVWGG